MVLIDTSIWVDYIRFGNEQLAALLSQDRVLMHDMVLGEIACGSLQQRMDRLAVLAQLPYIDSAEHSEVLRFIDNHQLHGCGIGYVDNHLLAAVKLRMGARLWSSDKRLVAAAQRLGLAFGAEVH
jgi:predicted nucleic acid-binding protein